MHSPESASDIALYEPSEAPAIVADFSLIMKALEDAPLPEELKPIIGAALGMVAPELLNDMIADAKRAKELIANGYGSEAKLIIDKYRGVAYESGYGLIFDSLFPQDVTG